MSLDNPRRIFNGRSRRRPSGGAVRLRQPMPGRIGALALFTLIGVSIAVGGAEDSTAAIGGNPPAHVVRAAAGETQVIDGGTLRVAGLVLRLDGVAAPPRQTEPGQAAIRRLAALVRDQAVDCTIVPSAGVGLAASCQTGGLELNAALTANR